MEKNICVFCSSSNAIAKTYFEQAALFGKKIATEQYSLLYGGAKVGLMGEIATNVHINKGKVIGVIPSMISDRELAYPDADELIITKTMSERKNILIEKADAFVCFPGGFGTLDEIMEVLTLRQLEVIDAPIIFFNQDGFFDHLLLQFQRAFDDEFTKQEYSQTYFVTNNLNDLFDHINHFESKKLNSKWYKTNLE